MYELISYVFVFDRLSVDLLEARRLLCMRIA